MAIKSHVKEATDQKKKKKIHKLNGPNKGISIRVANIASKKTLAGREG